VVGDQQRLAQRRLSLAVRQRCEQVRGLSDGPPEARNVIDRNVHGISISGAIGAYPLAAAMAQLAARPMFFSGAVSSGYVSGA
jgi:hypothetical protein